MTHVSAFWQGMFTGAGLIIAIGAQNAFVLTQGIQKNHALAVAVLCALIDAALIAAGVCGLGVFIRDHALLRNGAAIGGAAFLFWFGVKSLMEVKRDHSLRPLDKSESSLRSVIAATLAISLLNPHVYLDTVVMLGTISSTFPDNGGYYFGLGAATASFIWFFSLSFAGHLLAPLFTRPLTWKILHLSVCVVVWAIGASLLFTISF